jgi:hypothetical protein
MILIHSESHSISLLWSRYSISLLWLDTVCLHTLWLDTVSPLLWFAIQYLPYCDYIMNLQYFILWIYSISLRCSSKTVWYYRILVWYYCILVWIYCIKHIVNDYSMILLYITQLGLWHTLWYTVWIYCGLLRYDFTVIHFMDWLVVGDTVWIHSETHRVTDWNGMIMLSPRSELKRYEYAVFQYESTVDWLVEGETVWISVNQCESVWICCGWAPYYKRCVKYGGW